MRCDLSRPHFVHADCLHTNILLFVLRSVQVSRFFNEYILCDFFLCNILFSTLFVLELRSGVSPFFSLFISFLCASTSCSVIADFKTFLSGQLFATLFLESFRFHFLLSFSSKSRDLETIQSH